MTTNFSAIPVIDYSLARDPATKSQFLSELQNALINVGFLYLKNPPVPKADMDLIVDYIPKLFDLPQEAKEKMRLPNTPHFLGYSSLGTELTKGKTDLREQFEFGTKYQNTWKTGDPDYLKMWGDNQWPEEDELPGFKESLTRFMEELEVMSTDFMGLSAEALGISSSDLDVLFDEPHRMQHRTKIAKYPAKETEDSSDQGIGPHVDGGLFTYLLQASDHECLQVQNLSGKWINVPPIDNSFVINIGRGLEFITGGLTRATSHRVLSPAVGSKPRYSLPFNHSIGQNVRLNEIQLKFPPHILALNEGRDVAKSESINHTAYGTETSGMVTLISRIKTFPETGKRHYPELYKKYVLDEVKA